jgi:hypothetical protein
MFTLKVAIIRNETVDFRMVHKTLLSIPIWSLKKGTCGQRNDLRDIYMNENRSYGSGTCGGELCFKK